MKKKKKTKQGSATCKGSSTPQSKSGIKPDTTGKEYNKLKKEWQMILKSWNKNCQCKACKKFRADMLKLFEGLKTIEAARALIESVRKANQNIKRSEI